MKKVLLIIILSANCYAFSYDAGLLISKSAKERGCSKETPCKINFEEKENSIFVSVSKAVELEPDGILRFRPGSTVVYEYDLNGETVRIIQGR